MISEDTIEQIYSRKVQSEIDVFARQDALHQHAPMFNWRNERFLNPLFLKAFGCTPVAAIYATTFAAAIKRTGASKIFSLGCGDGEQEIEVLLAADQLGLPPFQIYGLELSPVSVNRALLRAEKAGLSDRFIVIERDLNQGIPEGEPPAAIMAHHVLHHFVALEQLFDNVAKRLHPDGVFVTFDMIGRNGHMLWPEVRPLAHRLWAMLPHDKRYDHVFRKNMPFYQDWDCSIEGFEGVRSQDILELMARFFVAEKLIVWGGISQVFLNERTCANFNPDDANDCAFIEAVANLELDLLALRRTTPNEMCGVFRPRCGKFNSAPDVSRRFARSLRKPGEFFEPILYRAFSSPYPDSPAAETPAFQPDSEIVISPQSPFSSALRYGWEEPEDHGVFAILDEQLIEFTLTEAVSFIELRIWNTLPPSCRQTITASAPFLSSAEVSPLFLRIWNCLPFSCRQTITSSELFCNSVVVDPLLDGEITVIRLEASRLPMKHWSITIKCTAYLRPDDHGVLERRPLSYLLIGLTTGQSRPVTVFSSLVSWIRERMVTTPPK